jgi:hypothetical protein
MDDKLLLFSKQRVCPDASSSLGPRASRPQTHAPLDTDVSFALRAHCGRAARGPSEELEGAARLNSGYDCLALQIHSVNGLNAFS